MLKQFYEIDPLLSAIFILESVLLGVGMLHCCMGLFPVLAGIAPSSHTVVYLFRTLWWAKTAGKMI